MSETLVSTSESGEPQSFDDVMLAMDVVDTLRYRERVLDKELDAEEREDALVERLRIIYKNQGIDVPDRILRDGVKALEEKRFVYEPPQNTLSVRLAKAYINRGRWLKPLALVFAMAAFLTGAYHFGVEAPRQASVKAETVALTETLPARLAAGRDQALALAETDNARTLVETLYQDGALAIADRNTKAANDAITALTLINEDLAAALTIRIISRPNEMSGVFRVHEDDPSIRNYYLIVEAVDARGRAHALEITNEETQTRRRVKKWGVRVPEGEFNRVAADKSDDQIIQNAIIGEKPRGALTPQYTIPTSSGAIVEW